jgi:hypothetical protein
MLKYFLNCFWDSVSLGYKKVGLKITYFSAVPSTCTKVFDFDSSAGLIPLFLLVDIFSGFARNTFDKRQAASD